MSISTAEGMGYRNWGFTGPIHVAGFGIDLAKTPLDFEPTSKGVNSNSGVKMFPAPPPPGDPPGFPSGGGGGFHPFQSPNDNGELDRNVGKKKGDPDGGGGGGGGGARRKKNVFFADGSVDLIEKKVFGLLNKIIK